MTTLADPRSRARSLPPGCDPGLIAGRISRGSSRVLAYSRQLATEGERLIELTRELRMFGDARTRSDVRETASWLEQLLQDASQEEADVERYRGRLARAIADGVPRSKEAKQALEAEACGSADWAVVQANLQRASALAKAALTASARLSGS
jgi:hypothetical protein